jgi:hypothetical protein
VDGSYLLTFKGIAMPLSDDMKDLLGDSSQTHSVVYLIEVPTEDFNDIKLNGTDVTEFDLLHKDGRSFLIKVQCLYADENGVTVSDTSEFTIRCQHFTVTYYTDVTSVILS